MGGRGAGANITSGRNAKMGDFLKPKENDDELDDNKIRRANDASFMDMGDIINRTFQRGKQEIGTLELTDDEKRDAISKLKELSTQALESASKAVNPYVSGRAKLSTTQKNGSASDKASSDRAKIDNFMEELRNKSKTNTKKKANVSLAQQLKQAQEEGKMEITIDGKTYRRKSKRGSWYA